MNPLLKPLLIDTWINMSWDEYIKVIELSIYEKAKGYYFKDKMRVEMSPIGTDHSRDHAIVIYAISLFAGINEISLDAHDNCSYRKAGFVEVQPDASFYMGENAEIIPWGTAIISLDDYPPPDLVIEISKTSLADDKGEKRLIYEAIEAKEYWIVDVNLVEIIAFTVENQGSRRITQSLVLPGLEIGILEEALRRTRQSNHGKVSAWLLTQFQEVLYNN